MSDQPRNDDSAIDMSFATSPRSPDESTETFDPSRTYVEFNFDWNSGESLQEVPNNDAAVNEPSTSQIRNPEEASTSQVVEVARPAVNLFDLAADAEYSCRQIALTAHMQQSDETSPVQLRTDNSINEEIEKQAAIIKLVNKQLHFVVNEVVPLRILNGRGFEEFTQELVDFGATYGRSDVRKILARRSTIQKLMPAKASEIYLKTIAFLKRTRHSLSVETYTDPATDKLLISVSAHYIDTDFKFRSVLIGIRPLHGRAMFDQIIAEKQLRIILKYYLEINEKKGIYCVVVTNCELESMELFKESQIMTSKCHQLLYIIHDFIQLIPRNIFLIIGLFQTYEELMRSPFDYDDNIVLHWMNTLHFLRCVDANYDEIKRLATNPESDRREWASEVFVDLKHHSVKQGLKILQLIATCWEKLSDTNRSRIDDVFLWRRKMENIALLHPSDTPSIVQLKNHLMQMVKRFPVEKEHQMAVYLNPKFKGLKFCTPGERVIISRRVRLNLEKIRIAFVNTGRPIQPRTFSQENHFDDLADAQFEHEASVIDDELTRYSYLKLRSYPDDPLQFWRNTEEFPLLKELAMSVFSIPASTHYSWRLFAQSHARSVEKWKPIRPKLRNCMVFLQERM